MCIKRMNPNISPRQPVIPLLQKTILFDFSKSEHLGNRYGLNPEYRELEPLLQEFMDTVLLCNKTGDKIVLKD